MGLKLILRKAIAPSPEEPTALAHSTVLLCRSAVTPGRQGRQQVPREPTSSQHQCALSGRGQSAALLRVVALAVVHKAKGETGSREGGKNASSESQVCHCFFRKLSQLSQEEQRGCCPTWQLEKVSSSLCKHHNSKKKDDTFLHAVIETLHMLNHAIATHP